MAKIEIFLLGKGYSCTILSFKNLLNIGLSLTVSNRFPMFYFPLKSKTVAKSGENWNFSTRKRILLYYPELQKFTQYRSISYGFFVLFPAKNRRWQPKVAKIEIFPPCLGYSSTTLWVKNLLEIVLSLTVFELFTLFNFPLKSKMAAKSGKIANLIVN